MRDVYQFVDSVRWSDVEQPGLEDLLQSNPAEYFKLGDSPPLPCRSDPKL